MKTNKSLEVKILGFTAVATIIGIGFATAVGASAYQGAGGIRGHVNPDARKAFNTALENGDYEACFEQHKGMMSEERFNAIAERQARHDELEKVLEENDFEAWSDFIAESEDWGRGRIGEVVTEENFPLFVEMHEAIEAGDAVRAKELREELGLDIRPRDGTGSFRGQGNHMNRGMMRGFQN